MPWFLVRLTCDVAADSEGRETLGALYDDDLQVLDLRDLRVGPMGSTAQRVELDLAVEAVDPSAARDRARKLLGETPDLAAAEIGPARPIADPRRLTETGQSVLREAADALLEELRLDVATLSSGGSYEETLAVSVHLPPVFSRHYTPALVERWASCLETVAGKLAQYPDTYLASTAEELAAHALLHECEGIIEERGDELEDAESALENFREIHDLAFEDHDVLMLFDAALDGLEDSSIGEKLGVVHLHPDDWFKPFRDEPHEEGRR